MNLFNNAKSLAGALAIVAGALTVTASAARADGFVCQSLEGPLTVQVYDNLQPTAGTRSVAVMVVSDPRWQTGNRLIARFSAENGTLSNSGTRYMANVDLRFRDIPAGEFIAGTRLGMLANIGLGVDYSYSQPLMPGQHTNGNVLLVARSGERRTMRMDCVRYLKQQ